LEQNLIDRWSVARDSEGQVALATITAFGADVVEGNVKPPIAISIDNGHRVHVIGGGTVQIGDHNAATTVIDVEKIITAIDRSAATESSKQEAKGLLSKFLEHPVIAAIIGGLASRSPS
jgi:hypothetical protein